MYFLIITTVPNFSHHTINRFPAISTSCEIVKNESESIFFATLRWPKEENALVYMDLSSIIRYKYRPCFRRPNSFSGQKSQASEN